MPDEVVIEEKKSVTTDPFDGSPTPVEVIKKEEPIVEKKAEEKPVIEEKKVEEKVEDKPFNEDEYVKKEYGWENKESGKKELEALRERAKELDLTSEESRKVLSYIREGKTKELFQFLRQQEEVERLLTADLSDKKVATELVKFGIANKNKNLIQDEVDFLFNERFSIPSKPTQGDDPDDEYAVKLENWKTQVETIEKRLVIEAKLSQPDLQKLKTELKLPDIVKTEAAKKEPTAEELLKIQQGRDLFIQEAEAGLKSFEGFNVTYKDKDVEVQSTYKLSDDESKAVINSIKLFAEKGFDANAIFGKRWVKDDKFNFIQMAKDLAAIDTEDNRSKKYMEDTATKAKIQYMKSKHAIDLGDGKSGGDLQLEDKEFKKKNEDAIWN